MCLWSNTANTIRSAVNFKLIKQKLIKKRQRSRHRWIEILVAFWPHQPNIRIMWAEHVNSSIAFADSLCVWTLLREWRSNWYHSLGGCRANIQTPHNLTCSGLNSDLFSAISITTETHTGTRLTNWHFTNYIIYNSVDFSHVEINWITCDLHAQRTYFSAFLWHVPPLLHRWRMIKSPEIQMWGLCDPKYDKYGIANKIWKEQIYRDICKHSSSTIYRKITKCSINYSETTIKSPIHFQPSSQVHRHGSN